MLAWNARHTAVRTGLVAVASGALQGFASGGMARGAAGDAAAPMDASPSHESSDDVDAGVDDASTACGPIDADAPRASNGGLCRRLELYSCAVPGGCAFTAADVACDASSDCKISVAAGCG